MAWTWTSTTQLTKLQSSVDALTRAVNALIPKVTVMSGTVTALDTKLADLTAKVQANTSTTESAVMALTAIPQMIQEAVDKAMAAGATAEELQAVTDLSDAITKNTSTLAAAIPGPATS